MFWNQNFDWCDQCPIDSRPILVFRVRSEYMQTIIQIDSANKAEVFLFIHMIYYMLYIVHYYFEEFMHESNIEHS